MKTKIKKLINTRGMNESFAVQNLKVQDRRSQIAFKYFYILIFFIGIIIYSSCKPEEPVKPKGKKPYCYWENGKEVCYDFPK